MALDEHGQFIADEVLATRFGQAGDRPADPALAEHTAGELGLTFWLKRQA